MANLKYYDIILKPVITEKSMNMIADKKYTFYVHPKANKTQIREAVEKMFNGVEVEKISTMNLLGKKRRRGNTEGRTSARKKAIVKLTSGSSEIELFQGM